ncbi:hypothetical protein VDGL01_11251 [Verticillium dahliae]
MSSRIVLAAAGASRGIFAISRTTFGHGIQTSTVRLGGLKESSQDEADSDKHKQDSLSKQRTGKGHWKPELASDGEEAVKADRNRTMNLTPSELAERTKNVAEEMAKVGTSMRDGL